MLPMPEASGQNQSFRARFIGKGDVENTMKRLNCVFESSLGTDKHTEAKFGLGGGGSANAQEKISPPTLNCYRQVMGGGFRAGPRALPLWVKGRLGHGVKQAPGRVVKLQRWGQQVQAWLKPMCKVDAVAKSRAHVMI